MSQEIHINFKVNSMAIMKKTLNQLGIDFKEQDKDCLQIGSGYRLVTIKSDEIIYDSMQASYVDKIKQAYTTNAYKDELIREGNTYKEEVQSNGKIRITVY